MNFTLLLVLIIYIRNDSIESARILAVFPTPSISHQVVFRPLTQELARRGHEVVIITTDPAFPEGQTPENLTEIDVHDLSYLKWKKFVAAADGVSAHWSAQFEMAFDVIIKIFEEQTNTENIQRILAYESTYFDWLLLEDWVRGTLGFSNAFKASVILVSSMGSALNDYEVTGAPTHPILYPTIVRDRLFNLTYWEKVSQFMKEFQYNRLIKIHETKTNEVLKRIFGTEVPPLRELYKNVEMLFLNIHPIWDNNRPVPPSVVFMGGLHQNAAKELPEDLKLFLDSSKRGGIYFSFGTNVKSSTMPLEKIEKFTNVFSRLPYDILWKWDTDELPGRSKNIRISKWLPQSDLLRHPKIKLFITQGGLQSTDEAITSEVPLIGIPMLCDQWYNVEKYLYHKIGVKVDIETISEQKLDNAIKTVIEDESYRQNIAQLHKLMKDQLQQPLDRAVWWTEYVLRHGRGQHLRAPAANISWAEYLELDLLLILVTFLLLCLVLLHAIIKKILGYFITVLITSHLKIKVA